MLPVRAAFLGDCDYRIVLERGVKENIQGKSEHYTASLDHDAVPVFVTEAELVAFLERPAVGAFKVLPRLQHVHRGEVLYVVVQTLQSIALQ